MAKLNNIYLVVISEDEAIPEEERIKIKEKKGYINLGNVFLCVLLLDDEKKYKKT